VSRSLAIQARGLSKRYSLQSIAAQVEYRTLSEQIANCVSYPWRWLTQPKRTAENPGWFWALQDVDFDVQHGEVIGIIGRNGNGKSTLLKILSKITAPTRGYADMQGRVCSLLEVGTGFHPELTGSENIFLNGSILGMTRREIQNKYDAIVAFSEVEQFLNTPVKRYSSGMRVRLAFSVAAHMDPDILIIDEVLAVGDLAFQQKCLKRMSEFASTGRTILFVSHNMPAVESICKRTLLISQGQIVEDGETHAIVAKFVRSMTQQQLDLGSAEISLQDHTQRNRGSENILKRLRILDASGTPSCAIPLGSPCCIEIAFQSSTFKQGLAFSVTIHSDSGQRIGILHSRIQSRVVTQGEQRGVVRCQLDELPLLPGVYSLDIAVGTWDQVLDSIDQVAQISVLPTDYYQTGELPSTRHGVVVLQAHWTCIPAESIHPIPNLAVSDVSMPISNIHG
jgi:lipopolysaccharide transport system ATP-binding protein